MCFGTREICKQVVTNIMIYDTVQTYTKTFMPTSIANYALKEFMNAQLNNAKPHMFINHLSNFLSIKVDQVNQLHRVLLRKVDPYLPDEIKMSESCWYNKICK
jgi:hypothetical protein